MPTQMPNDHRKPFKKGVSRVAPHAGAKRKESVRIVIWSALHGDMQQSEGSPGCALLPHLTTGSCDSILGLPFNLASYALLCHMFAQQADLEVGDLIWVGGDVHLYKNHIAQATLQISRDPRPLPTLQLNKASSMFEYQFDDFKIEGYDPWPTIKAEVAV